jgi:hypothetical protein
MARPSFLTSSLAPLLALASGCVIPVAPKWSDPDRNYPPTIVTANPPVGTVLGRGPDGGAAGQVEVEVSLADQNTGDNLYLRWIVDYPPYVSGKTLLALETTKPGGDTLVRTPAIFAPDCVSIRSRALADHRLLLAISDRPFKLPADDPGLTEPDAVDDGNHRIEAVWSFTLSCQ